MAERELLLIRHGIAVDRIEGLDDAVRPLTPKGRQRTRAIMKRARALGLAAQALVSSPLTRAVQTAQIAVATGLAPAMTLSRALEPGGEVLGLLEDWLISREGAPGPARLALVGHEPDLGELAARLIGAPPSAISLRKAGMALIALGEENSPSLGRATLRLLLTPRVVLASHDLAASATKLRRSPV